MTEPFKIDIPQATLDGILAKVRAYEWHEMPRGAGLENSWAYGANLDFMKALSDLGERYLVEEPVCKDTLGIEIGLESMRNPKVGAIYRSVDRFVRESFEKLFRRLAQEGRIAPDLDIPMVANLFSIIADGMGMRRATDPDFDARMVMPAVMGLIGICRRLSCMCRVSMAVSRCSLCDTAHAYSENPSLSLRCGAYQGS